MRTPEIILKEVWGYDSFRDGQSDIIQSILNGRDTLALLPTGAGKSLCYQVPALVQEKLCIVISPLIALMADQVRELGEKGIIAENFSGIISRYEADRILDNCRNGHAQFLYISPERLMNEFWLEQIAQLPIGFIAVDEAHCISQWGYDFRPAYLRIGQLRTILPKTPILALTATATKEVAEDIQSQMRFQDGNFIRRSFERPNLAYQVRYSENRMGDLLQLLHRHKGQAIVYAPTRRLTESISLDLERENIESLAYHAGLDTHSRSRRQASWLKEETRVIVATSAFGMGINKPNVRLVVHWEMPESLEAYFQEAGRAGRDGKESMTVVLEPKGRTDEWYSKKWKEWPEVQDLTKVYSYLCSSARIPLGEGAEQKFFFSFSDAFRAIKLSPAQLRKSLDMLQQLEIIEFDLEGYQPAEFQFIQDPQAVYKSLEARPELFRIAQYLGRSYSGIFLYPVRIDLLELRKRQELSTEEVYDHLDQLARLHLAHFSNEKKESFFQLVADRVEEKHLPLNINWLKERQKLYQKQLKRLKYFMSSNDLCRNVKVLDYLGEPRPKNCGKCDHCLKSQNLPTRKEIRSWLEGKTIEGKMPPRWYFDLPFHQQGAYWDELRYMIDEGRILN